MTGKTHAAAHPEEQLLTARRLGATGAQHLAAKQIEASYRCFEQVYEIARANGHRGLESDALGSMGMVYLETGDPALALQKLKEGLTIAQEIADQKREMAHLGTLGNVYLNLAAGEEAVRFFTQALDLAEVLGDKRAKAGYLTNLATIEKNARQFEKAGQLFEQVRKLTRELGDVPGERNALRHLITLYSERNSKHDLVLVYLQRACVLSQQLHDEQGEAAYQDALILSLLSLNRQREALQLLDAALADERLTLLPERKLQLLVNRGNACFDEHWLDEAFTSYQQALKLAIRRQNWQVEARMLGRLGAVEAERGNVAAAVSFAQQSLAKAERIDDDLLRGEQYCMLALVHRDMGETEEAITYCRQAVDTFAEDSGHPLREKSLRLLEELRLEPVA